MKLLPRLKPIHGLTDYKPLILSPSDSRNLSLVKKGRLVDLGIITISPILEDTLLLTNGVRDPSTLAKLLCTSLHFASSSSLSRFNEVIASLDSFDSSVVLYD